MRVLKLIVLSLAGLCLTGLDVLAQDGPFGYFNDALRFSTTSPGGTARIKAIGGAQVSLGGDASLAGSNPAGLGFFNRSTFTFTPAMNFYNAESDFLDESNSSFRTRFNLPQIGVVLNRTKPSTSSTGFRGGSFAITIGRTNDFNNQVEYVGFNNQNSIIDSFIEFAGQTDPADLGGFEGIAYDHFLIDLADFDSDIDYFFDEETNIIIPNDGDGTFEGYGSLLGAFGGSLPRQTETIRTTGGQSQVNLAWGGNYSDRFYFGGGIGIATINYRQERTYIEDQFAFDDGTLDDVINSIVIEDELDVEGTGINASIGVIVRPVRFLTVGLSYTSPTIYSINEESLFNFTTNWSERYAYALPDDTVALGQIITQSDIQVAEYNLRTPSRLNLGSTFFFGKSGFLSADVEFVDYSTASLRTSDFREQADNDVIADSYQSVFNVRLGGEFRIDQFRLRAGYSHLADPIKDNTFDGSITDLSLGLGFRDQNYFIDVAVINRTSDNNFSPYSLAADQPVADISNSATSALLTFGFVF